MYSSTWASPDLRQNSFFCNWQPMERYVTTQSAGNKRLGAQSYLRLNRIPVLTLLSSRHRTLWMRGGKNIKSRGWKGAAKCPLLGMMWPCPSQSHNSCVKLNKTYSRSNQNHSEYSKYTVHPPDSIFCTIVTRSSYSSITMTRYPLTNLPNSCFPLRTGPFIFMMQTH